jgi:hypothetical protein
VFRNRPFSGTVLPGPGLPRDGYQLHLRWRTGSTGNSTKGKNMKTTTNAIRQIVSMAMLCGAMGAPMMAVAQDKPYTEGTVWTVSMIRVKPGLFDVYMRDVLPLRKKIDEEAKKQGLVVSSHTLSGNAMGRDDWDVMFLVEYKNWAAFDGLRAKYDAIAAKVVGTEEKQVQLMTKRGEEREIIGNKTMQELIAK